MVLSEIFGPEIVIVVLYLIGPVLAIVAIVDVARRPEWAWQASGQNKTLWLVLEIVGIFLCGLGLIVSLIYLLAIRPKVAAAQAGGGPGAGPYGGTPYGGTTYGGQYGGPGYASPPAYGGTPAPGYGTPAPGYGTPAPGYGTPAPAPAPGYGSAPTYGTPAPGSTPAAGTDAPPPGWYPDPQGSGQPRYWDGNAWLR